MFWHKKPMNSEEYEKLHKKISEISNELAELKRMTKTTWDNTENLRGKFNRQLGKIRPETEDEAGQAIALNSQFNIGFP